MTLVRFVVKNGPIHHICANVSYAETSHFNTHADVHIPGRTRDLSFGLSLHLYAYFVHASSEGSGEPVYCTGSPESSLLDNAVTIQLLCARLMNNTLKND